MLEVDHVRRSFGPIAAVRDVSFTIPVGSTFGLLGPNGAGKTTTMRMILGILAPDGGGVRWDGKPIDARSRRRFGYLPEERGLYGKMKVGAQIAYFARLHGVDAGAVEARTARWIDDLELGEYADRPCAELSKGNQQKVQVACAAVHEPALLVLDEPFSGLDPVNAEMLLRNLERLRAKGTTLVLSSHQMWQLETLCERFCIIAGGETRVAGSLPELRARRPARLLVVEPASEPARRILIAIPGAREEPPNPSAPAELRVRVPVETDLAAVLRALVQTTTVTRFERLEPSLQEIYLNAIGAAA